MDKPTDYQVGYRRPPISNRFKPGRSGNPRGRPKGKKNVATILEQELHKPIVITSHGRKKTVSVLEAAVRRLLEEALVGDLGALKLLLSLLERTELESGQTMAAEMGADDAKIIEGILRRFESSRRDDQ